jgi:dsDNA-specific endonuclease/ATPase MutS2
MDTRSPERMVEVVTALSVLSDVLTDLIVKLASATTDEIPALRAQAEALTQRVIECCADTATVDHLPAEEVAAIRSELLQLAAAMKAQIASIVDVRLAPFTSDATTSRTRH